MKYIKLEGVADNLGLERTDKTVGMMFVLGLTFWKTTQKNVFISHYDVTRDKDLRSENLVQLVYIGRSTMLISGEVLSDCTEFDFKIKELKNSNSTN